MLLENSCVKRHGTAPLDIWLVLDFQLNSHHLHSITALFSAMWCSPCRRRCAAMLVGSTGAADVCHPTWYKQTAPFAASSERTNNDGRHFKPFKLYDTIPKPHSK